VRWHPVFHAFDGCPKLAHEYLGSCFYNQVMNPQESKDSNDTNFGWWTDKPVREERPSSFVPLRTTPAQPSSSFSWSNVFLVVLLLVALGWSLKFLVSW
jgi:hypothetical protein